MSITIQQHEAALASDNGVIFRNTAIRAALECCTWLYFNGFRDLEPGITTAGVHLDLERLHAGVEAWRASRTAKAAGGAGGDA